MIQKNITPFYHYFKQNKHFPIFNEYSVTFQIKYGLPSSYSDFIFDLLPQKETQIYGFMCPNGENNCHKMFDIPEYYT